MILKLIRTILSQIILFLDALFPAKPAPRSELAQAKVDQATASWVIYQFKGCPFCVKVRRGLSRRGIKVEYRDALLEPYRSELLKGGGKIQVPCLRTTDAWIYESSDILEFADLQIL